MFRWTDNDCKLLLEKIEPNPARSDFIFEDFDDYTFCNW